MSLPDIIMCDNCGGYCTGTGYCHECGVYSLPDDESEEDCDPLNYEDDPVEDDMAEAVEKYELALSCRCGAWVLRDNKPMHCGDCVCGAQ